MEKGNLPDEFAIPDQDLVQDPRSGRRSSIAEEPVKIHVRPLSFDSRAYVGVRVRQGRSRRGDIHMVIGAWSNNIGHLSEC